MQSERSEMFYVRLAQVLGRTSHTRVTDLLMDLAELSEYTDVCRGREGRGVGEHVINIKIKKIIKNQKVQIEAVQQLIDKSPPSHSIDMWWAQYSKQHPNVINILK
jgi:hypothetical protein